MALLTTQQVTDVVTESLSSIADLPTGGNILASPLTGMNDMQQHMFLSALKTNLNALPYNMNNGSTTKLAYYDVSLVPDIVDEWPTVGDCVNWVVANQRVVYLQ